MKMISPMSFITLASLLAILFIINESTGAVVHHDVNGNNVPVVDGNIHVNSHCCYVPACRREAWREVCFDTLRCDHICAQGIYRAAHHWPTPGYKLTAFYYGRACHFGECKPYKFSCEHCQNPNDPTFSIYTVPSYCKNCYCKNC